MTNHDIACFGHTTEVGKLIRSYPAGRTINPEQSFLHAICSLLRAPQGEVMRVWNDPYAVGLANTLTALGWQRNKDTARTGLYRLIDATLKENEDLEQPRRISLNRRRFLKAVGWVPALFVGGQFTDEYYKDVWRSFVGFIRSFARMFNANRDVAIWLRQFRDDRNEIPDSAWFRFTSETREFLNWNMSWGELYKLKDAVIEEPRIFVENPLVRQLFAKGFLPPGDSIEFHKATKEKKGNIRELRREASIPLLDEAKKWRDLEPQVLYDLANFTSLGDEPGFPNDALKLLNYRLRHDDHFGKSLLKSVCEYHEVPSKRSLVSVVRGGIGRLRGPSFSYSALFAACKAELFKYARRVPEVREGWGERHEETVREVIKAAR